MRIFGGGWSENALDSGLDNITAVVSANGWGDITTLTLSKGTWLILFFVYPNTNISNDNLAYSLFDGPNHVRNYIHIPAAYCGIYATGNTVPVTDVVNIPSNVTLTLSVWRKTGRTGSIYGRIIAYKLSD